MAVYPLQQVHSACITRSLTEFRPDRGASSCSSLGWPAGWPCLLGSGGKNSGWHKVWL